MKLALLPTGSLYAVTRILLKPLPWCIHAATVVGLVWVVQRLMVPAPEIVPAMPTARTDKYQMDQRAEARLLGVETAGGLTPPAAVLLGVFANDQGQGAAVLAVDGQPPQAFSVGQEIGNGWHLMNVFADHVVISRSGQRQQIDLPRPENNPNQFQVIQQP